VIKRLRSAVRPSQEKQSLVLGRSAVSFAFPVYHGRRSDQCSSLTGQQSASSRSFVSVGRENNGGEDRWRHDSNTDRLPPGTDDRSQPSISSDDGLPIAHSSEELVTILKHILSREEALLAQTTAKLSPKARRKFLRALFDLSDGTRSEKDKADHIFEVMDHDQDGRVSQREFRLWFNSLYLPSVMRDAQNPDVERRTTQKTAEVVIFEEVEEEEIYVPPSTAQLLIVGLRSSIPYVGFGIMDNSLMLFFGDYIDRTLGVALCLNTMAAAGIGNLLSCATGVVAGGFIERLTYNIGLPSPELTPAQAQSSTVKNAHLIGSVIGIGVGCTIGMFPLLFMENSRKRTE